jgi:hypothetical protein
MFYSSISFIFRLILFITVFHSLSLAKSDIFFAKVEPFEEYKIKASAKGLVTYVSNSLEGTYVQSKTLVIQIDDTLEKIELQKTKEKLKILKTIKQIEEKNYKTLFNISTKSILEKDTQKIKVLNLQLNIKDLELKIVNLKDTISKKSIYITDKYIKRIDVTVGDFVNIGSLVALTQDISKAKLVIYLPIDNIDNYKDKTIYINNQKTDFKISKIYKVADDKYISSYKADIIIPKPKQFSKLLKVEFR